MNLRALSSALLFTALLAGSAAAQTTIRVPADQPTIQAGIDAAIPGDTVLVAPGTYVERISFLGKAITVQSETGPAGTVIDGNGRCRGDGQLPRGARRRAARLHHHEWGRLSGRRRGGVECVADHRRKRY
jgi:hypothetical protein